MEAKTFRITAIRDSKLPTYSYTDGYLISLPSFKCSDSFQARWYPTDPSHLKHWKNDFRGFRLPEDVEKMVPDFYVIAKAFKATIKENSVLARSKVHAWFLFKMIRHYMSASGAQVLHNIATLIKEGIPPYNAFVIGSYAILHDPKYNDNQKRSIFTGNYIFTLGSNRRTDDYKGEITMVPMTMSVDHFLDVMGKVGTISALVRCENDSNVQLARMNVRIGSDPLPIFYITDGHATSKDLKNDKKYMQRVKEFNLAIKKKQFNIASKMMIEKNYWSV